MTSRSHTLAAACVERRGSWRPQSRLFLWTVFPFVWILLTSLKNAGDIISVPPKFVFKPTFDNYAALVLGEQQGQYASARPDFPRYLPEQHDHLDRRRDAVARWPAFPPPTRWPASPSH